METELDCVKNDMIIMLERIIQLEYELSRLKAHQCVHQNMGAIAERRAQSLEKYRLEYVRQHGNTTPTCNGLPEDEID